MSFNLLILFLKTHSTVNHCSIAIDLQQIWPTTQKQMAFQIFKYIWVTVGDSPDQVRSSVSTEASARGTACSEEDFLLLTVSFLYSPAL